MSISIDHLTGDGSISVISRIDPAIKYSDESYSEYLKSLDENDLEFKEDEEPTRFILRKTIPYKLTQKIKANQVRMDKKEVYWNMQITAEEVRYSLMDIENPSDMKGKTGLKYEGTKIDDGKGGSMQIASETTMGLLSQLGIIDDLYAARRNYLEVGLQSLKKS